MEQHEALDLQDLRLSVSHALDIIDADSSIVDAEVCASWCEQQIGPILYDTEHPAEVGQRPQSQTTLGIGILIVTDHQDGRQLGFGSEHQDLSPDGIKEALEHAKANALHAPFFKALPRPQQQQERLTFHDYDTLQLPLDDIAGLSSEALDGALSTLRNAGFVTHLHVQGQVMSRKEHLMVGNTQGILAGETSTGLIARLRTRLIQEESQGTGHCIATHLQDFSPYDAGVEAAQRALQMRQGIQLESRDYPVVFAPEAMAALVHDALIPALSLDTVATGLSPFASAYGHLVASTLLNLSDEGHLPRRLGSRAMTGEGLPTGTTPLIASGQLIGFLSNAYHAQAHSNQLTKVVPRNGMRHALHQQSYAMRAGIFPTNVVIQGNDTMALDDLLEPIDDGVYIGGLWGTTPQGAPQHGNLLSTVIGPSFHIRKGKLDRPLRNGTMRLQINLQRLLQDITGIATDERQVASPTLQSLVLTPAVRCRLVRLAE